MKFVCVGILLVVLLGSALAKPDYFPNYDDAVISDGRYPCFLDRNCEVYIGNANSLSECCYRLGGQSFLNYATCTP